MDIIIERDKNYKVYVCIYLVVFIVLQMLYVFRFEMRFIKAVLINSPAYLLMVLDLISYGRTFVVDEEGCTVCIGRYRKKYTWDELKTKRIDEYHLPARGIASCPYLKEAILAPYRIHKPKMIRARTYSLMHPISCIYINFSIGGNTYQTGRYYEVNETLFMQKMKEWNVALQQNTEDDPAC